MELDLAEAMGSCSTDPGPRVEYDECTGETHPELATVPSAPVLATSATVVPRGKRHGRRPAPRADRWRRDSADEVVSAMISSIFRNVLGESALTVDTHVQTQELACHMSSLQVDGDDSSSPPVAPPRPRAFQVAGKPSATVRKGSLSTRSRRTVHPAGASRDASLGSGQCTARWRFGRTDWSRRLAHTAERQPPHLQLASRLAEPAPEPAAPESLDILLGDSSTM